MNIRSSNDKIDKVFAATIDLIGEYGLQNTPMSKVSKKSGVSPGTIYHYFENKEELIQQLYLHLKEELAQIIFADYDISKPFKDRFESIWRQAFDYMLKNPDKYSVMEQCKNSPQILEPIQEQSQRFFAPFIGFITEGVQTEQIKDIPLEMTFAFLNATITSTIQLAHTKAIEVGKNEIDTAFQLCWDGLAR